MTKENTDWVTELGQVRGRLYNDSEIARKIRLSRENIRLSRENNFEEHLNLVADLAVECVKVFGEAYVYERLDFFNTEKWGRREYLLGYPPRFQIVHGFLGGRGISGRVDGEDNEDRIIAILDHSDKRPAPPLIELLKNKPNLTIELVRNYRDNSNLAAMYVTHNTYKLTF